MITKNRNHILIHLGFWFVYTLLTISVLSKIISSKEVILLVTVTNLTGMAFLVYIYLYYILPKFWDTKKYIQFSTIVLIAVVLSAIFRVFLLRLFLNPTTEHHQSFIEQNELFFQFAIGGLFILLIASPLRIIDIYYKKENLEKELHTNKLEAELKFLKAQVNPHFLFNALNNIYSLSFTESKQTPTMILKLSEMMSFMLYDCKNLHIGLDQEIQYLRNYIDLQLLKKEGEQEITLEVIGDPVGKLITPMLFIPFYENAIKHGNIDTDKQGFINSQFEVRENSIHFKIINSIDRKISIDQLENSSGIGGVGLENVKKRLELLYPGKHELNINNSDTLYELKLLIQVEHSFNRKDILSDSLLPYS